MFQPVSRGRRFVLAAFSAAVAVGATSHAYANEYLYAINFANNHNRLIRIELTDSTPGSAVPFVEIGIIQGIPGDISHIGFDYRGVLWGRYGDYLLRFADPSVSAAYTQVFVGAVLPTAGCLGICAFGDTAPYARLIVAHTPNGHIGVIEPDSQSCPPPYFPTNGTPAGTSRGLARFPFQTTIYEGRLNDLWRFDLNSPGSNVRVGPMTGTINPANIRCLSPTPAGDMWGMDFNTRQICRIGVTGAVLEHHTLLPTGGAAPIQLASKIAYPAPCDPNNWNWSDCDDDAVPDSCQILAQPELDCNGNGQLDACEIAAGTSDDCNGNGVPDECEAVGSTPIPCNPAVPNSTTGSAEITAVGSDVIGDMDLRLFVSDVPIGQPGYFFGAHGLGFVSPGGSSGNACAIVGLGRYSMFSQLYFGAGLGALVPPCGLSVGDIPVPTNPVTPILPGDTWYWQAWFRDGATSHFSNVVEVTFQ